MRNVGAPKRSTKTKRSDLVAAAIMTRQAALKNSSLSLASIELFRLHPNRLSIRKIVESLTETPHTRPRNSRLSGRVAAGRYSRSASSSLLASSSSLGLEPGRFFGASGLPSRDAPTT
jgi:hypothetical protein